MTKIGVITGSRAEWGILRSLVKLIHSDEELELQLFVTGSHLSHEFGYTVTHIDFPIAAKVECVVSSDTPVGISKSMGLALVSFGEVYERFKPNVLVALGDRYELVCAVLAGYVHGIPVAHIHGGEITEGVYDNAFRHAITHMSQLHFTTAEPYRQRVIQLGEPPETVFNVGALGCDGLTKRDKQRDSMTIVQCFYGIDPEYDKNKNFVVDINGSHDMNYRSGEYSFTRDYFLELLKDSKCIIGNSSSGIIEAPALGVPTINVGDRQKGRLMADSIIQAEPTRESIKAAFDKLRSKEFQALMQTDYYTPYKGGNVAEKIHAIIKAKTKEGLHVRKTFYDLPATL